MPKEIPTGVAIVICERVIAERGTGNKTLVSTFNCINSKQFPCRHDRMSVYIALTNGQGEAQIELHLKRLNGDQQVAKLGGKIIFDDPNHVVELIFNLRNVTFLEPGVYSFEVYADTEYIFDSRFNVVLIEPSN